MCHAAFFTSKAELQIAPCAHYSRRVKAKRSYDRVLGLSWKFLIPILSLIFLCLQLSFMTNFFGVAPDDRWQVWSPDGAEAMILKRVEVDILQRPVTSLGLAAYAGDEISVFKRLESQNLSYLSENAPETFIGYRSEAGGYSRLLSFAWRNLGCSSVTCLQLVNTSLMSFCIIGLAVGMSLLGSSGLGWAFIASMSFSPWIAMIARNLFWSPWLYLLPALAVLGFLLSSRKVMRVIAAAAIPVSFFAKYWGSGYREFVTITVLAMTMPLIALLFEQKSQVTVRRRIFEIFLVGVSSLGGFVAALLVHAHWMSGAVGQGLRDIWEETVLRRTYGDPDNFIAAYSESLESNPILVIWQYIWPAWSTDLLSFSLNKSGSLIYLGLGSQAFAVLLIAALLTPIVRFIRHDKRWTEDALLLLFGLSSTVLWFLAARGYAYVHTHILFFVWYFLTLPVVLFIVLRYGFDMGKQLRRKYFPSKLS